jgi:hypothetical protein
MVCKLVVTPCCPADCHRMFHCCRFVKLAHCGVASFCERPLNMFLRLRCCCRWLSVGAQLLRRPFYSDQVLDTLALSAGE